MGMNQWLGKVVIAHRTPQTVRVCVDNYKLHPVLLKYYISKKLYMVHDANEETVVGDMVLIGQRHDSYTSRRKTFKILKIVEPVMRKGGETVCSTPNDASSSELRTEENI